MSSTTRATTTRRRAPTRRELTRRYNWTTEDDPEQRERLLSDLFGSVEGDAHIEPPFRCDYGSNIHVGEGFYANFDCVVLDVCRVGFGRNCLLGPGVHVYTAIHSFDAEKRAAGLEYGKPVTVGDGVWIGGRAVLDPGVTVGNGSMMPRVRSSPRTFPTGWSSAETRRGY